MANKAQFHFFPGEVEMQLARFDRQPVSIIDAFMGCFDSEGKQQFEVPEHILEALAARFHLLMAEEPSTNSLNEAFGGRIARQRNALREYERCGEVAFDVIARMRELQREDRKGRRETPYETAVAEAAQKHGLEEDNVREKYKSIRRR